MLHFFPVTKFNEINLQHPRAFRAYERANGHVDICWASLITFKALLIFGNGSLNLSDSGRVFFVAVILTLRLAVTTRFSAHFSVWMLMPFKNLA